MAKDAHQQGISEAVSPGTVGAGADRGQPDGGHAATFAHILSLLEKHQWSGTAYGNYGTARICPECLGIHPEDALNNDCGNYVLGKGHKLGCKFYNAIRFIRNFQ